MQDTEEEAFSQPSPFHTAFLPDKNKGSTERLPDRPCLNEVYPQVIASCLAQMLVIQPGINMAYSAILLPQLMAPESDFKVSTEEASWIASLMAIATPVGALVCGPFMDLLGRKKFSVMATVPVTLSWLLLLFTPNYIETLYLARVLAGFGGGLTTVSLVYISEIAEASWRPTLLCLNSVFVSLGILGTNALGVWLAWRTVALVAALLSLASAAAIALYNPESPVWLLTFHSRSDTDTAYKQAKNSMRWLYPNQRMFAKEWDRLTTSVREKQEKLKLADSDLGVTQRVRQMAVQFTKRSSLLPLSLLATIFLFQQLSGTYPIIFYAVQVFQSIGDDFGAGLNANSATVLLGIIRFATSLLTVGLSRSCGRRPLLIVSGTGMAVAGLVAAIYFQETCVFNSVFNNNRVHSNNTSVLNSTEGCGDQLDGSSKVIGLMSVLLFVFMSSIGFLVIPWTLVGEILPVSFRGTGGGLLVSYAYLLMFGIVKVFPFLFDVFHISGLFYFFSFTSLVNVLIVYLFLPETLGKSFDEIEKFFGR